MMKTPSEFQIRQLMRAVEPSIKHAATPSQASPPSIPMDALDAQRTKLAALIRGLEQKLAKLEALIKKKEAEEGAVDRKTTAKKERAAKENTKPKTAAQKANIDRANARLRDKNKQAPPKASSNDKLSLSELQALATRVRGQIAVAKQKLAAL